jgi:alpha-galactosidase
MPLHFENAAIQLEINLPLARWSVYSRVANGPSLIDLQLNLGYRSGRKYTNTLDTWPQHSLFEQQIDLTNHGPGKLIRIETAPNQDHLHTHLTFVMLADHPLLLWKITSENHGSKPVNIEALELFSAGYIHRGRRGPHGQVEFPLTGKSRQHRSASTMRSSHPLNLTFYSNGWQSWSHSRSYRATDQYLQTHLGFLRAPLVKNPQTPNPRRSGMFASDMFAMLGDHVSRNGILFGFLSQKNQFGSIESWLGGSSPALKMWASGDGARLDPGSQVETDWACLQFLHLDDPDPLAPYIEAVMREHQLSNEQHAGINSPTGWCSWYQFMSQDYTGRLKATDVQENLRSLKHIKDDIPLDVIQIDDGFETQIGDWFSTNKGFADGLAPLAAEIKDAGFTPGIWLAPFIMHPKSNLAQEHPQWILRNSFGLPVNAGFLWNTFTRSLDLTHPGAQDYVREVIHTAAHDWDYSYLKLDFLYAAALPGKFSDATRTRAQVLRSALELVRQEAGDSRFLLGCGCPLGPAIGLVDGMRIGADTAVHWMPYFKGIQSPLKKEASFPSAFYAAHNALTRFDIHKRWWINDPDCLLLRQDTELNKTEVETIASVIALTGGSLIISDHIPGLPKERLNIMKSLLPVIGKRPYILDRFDKPTPEKIQLDLEGPTGSWHVIGIFNWSDSVQDKLLRLSDFYLEGGEEMYAREFWSGKIYRPPPGDNAESGLVIPQVPAHGAVILAVRTRHPYQPQYLGSNLHISQGLEVTNWQPGDGRLQFDIARPGYSNGKIELALPGKIEAATANNSQISWQSTQTGIYSFDLEFNKHANIEIIYS